MFTELDVSYDEIFEFYDEALRNALVEATAIIYDGCHKIYILTDEQEREEVLDNGGYYIVPNLNLETSLTLIREWYEESCGLEFVNMILPVEGEYKDENERYVRIISQCLDEM